MYVGDKKLMSIFIVSANTNFRTKTFNCPLLLHVSAVTDHQIIFMVTCLEKNTEVKAPPS